MKTWDNAWKAKEKHTLWKEPDPFVVSLIPQLRESRVYTVLDLGFGLGRHAILFAKEGFNVYGIEPSPVGLEHAKAWAEEEALSLSLVLGEMGHLSYQNDFFDLIVTWSVIYHGYIKEIYQAVSEIKRCLRTNGFLLCTLISTKHRKFGLGKEIEKKTFVIQEEEEKSYPHHYFDREEAEMLLSNFSLLECRDVEQYGSGSFHWKILAQLTS